MSEQVKRAIDGGLCGLRVTEGDVAAILRRVREEGTERRRKEKEKRGNWRFGMALAVVMAALVCAVGLRLVSRDMPDVRPLDDRDAQQTEVPGGFVPVDEAVTIDAARAIALAEEHVHAEYDPTVDLRDGMAYEIRCEYVMQETTDGAEYRNFFAVAFAARTIEDTDYTLRVSAWDGRILSCKVQRGAQEGHTAQEIWAGFARVYGSDRRAWTQEQLRTCCLMLKTAAKGSLRWEDYLYIFSDYPDVAESAMPREEVLAAMERDRARLLYAHIPQLLDGRWRGMQMEGDFRLRYIGAYPNPVWQVAMDERVITDEGCEFPVTVLIEVDSVTGEVKQFDLVDALYADQHEGFTRATIDALMATATIGEDPSLTGAEYREIAADCIRQRWSEDRDVNDETLFTCTEVTGSPALLQCDRRLIYRSTGAGEVTEYVVYVNWYGEVIAANRSVTPAGEMPFTPTVPDLDWQMENLLAWQSQAAASSWLDAPAVRAFTGTVWLQDNRDGVPQPAQNAVLKALQARNVTMTRCVTIEAEPNPVIKIAMETDQGVYLAEVDSVTYEVLHLLKVNGIYENWYLPFVLTADLEAQGVPVPEDAAPVYLTAATEDHGTNGGMRVDHLYRRFKDLYGPNMGLWTPEQLRSFQRIAVLSSDYDNDLGVLCLRNTVFPDVPENALAPAEAMVPAVTAIGMGGDSSQWQLCGAVLIGTTLEHAASGTPVWKLCLSQPGGGVWYAEVNCMTGQVYRLHQDAEGPGFPGACYDFGTPQNLWFREIVLEETIEACEAVWDCRGHG